MTPHRDEMLTEDTPSFLTETCRKFKKKAQIVAVASAIGDVIEEQNGPLVPASFFGVIITSLSDGKEKTEDEIANLLSLLSFVLEKASAAILRVKFSHVCGVLLNIFSQCPESAIILAKLASCISLLLQAQDPNTLHQKEAMSCIHFLLSISSDERNVVSRAAHVGLLSIFKSSNASTRKLVSGALYQFVHKILTSQPTPSEGTLVSILRLVKIVFRYLSANHIGTLCEDILRLPMLAISSVTAASFQSILALINENEEEEEELITLQAPQLISLVDTLADMQPHFNDTKPLIDYAILIGHLFNELARVDGNACAQRLPAVVERLIINFAADNNEIKQITHDALVTIVNGCISEDMIKQALASPKAPLRSVVESLESSLSPKYNRSWDKGLLVIAALFDKLGVHSGEMLGSVLATVGELYNTLTPQTHMPVFAVLGFAISSMGPKRFLEILPLNLDAPEAQSGPVPNRAWLLPLLRSNIEETDLKFFVDYFIPLANQVTAWSKRAESVGRLVEAKNKQILHDQIWDLFPSFCNLPIDVAQNFKTIARTLGTLLKDTDSLRKVLCTGLLKLIEKHMEVAALPAENPESRVTIAMAKASLKAIAQFATNFLPILFSIFEKLGPTDNKDTLFNLITAYLKISEPQAVSNFFRKLMEKLLEASTELKKEEDDDEMLDDEKELRRKEAAEAEKARKALVDSYSALSSAFVPSLSIGDLDFLFRVIKPFFKSNVVHTQKKAYKILRGMCTREVFVKKNYEEVRGLVVRSNECSSAAKKQRVFVLSELQSHMAIEEVTSPSLLADIIFCSREINAAARKVALQMIVAIAHRVQTEDAESGLKNYLNLVIAGLAGTTPVMISGSISALTALVTEFKDVISPIFIKDLFFTMTVLLQSKYSEVLSETISFLKATMSMVDADDMKPALKQLADGFAYMMQEHKGKFRDYGVHVMVKLMKRYGYDTLVPLFPEDCHKVLRAINKRENKKKDKSSKKDKDSEGEESDSDESDSEFVGDNLVGGNKIYEQQDQPETFIIEDEEPLDFLDKQAMKRVISAKPQEQKEKQKKKSEFKMLPDGRLLIQDSDDDEDSHNIYFDKTSEKLPIDDRLMDSVDRELFGSKSRRMTKKRMLENDRKVEDADSDDEVDQVRPMNEKFKRNNRPKATPKYAGHQFKAKKAGGDIKIGKLEPFAYIPLDVRNLNKRRRHQAVNTFKPISKSSKKTTN